MTRRIITGVYPPGSKLPQCGSWRRRRGSTPTLCSGPWPSWSRTVWPRPDRTAGRLVTQDTAILDAVRRAEAHVVVNQYYHAMAELGYSQQEATAMLKEEEQ